MNDVDRDIAALLGYHVVFARDGFYRDCYYVADKDGRRWTDGYHLTEAEAMQEAERDIFTWSIDIAEALALAAELGMDLMLVYWPPLEEWQAFPAQSKNPAQGERYHSAPADKPAEAVAAAILAWLRAREGKA